MSVLRRRGASPHCNCVWLGHDGRPILFNRLCFIIDFVRSLAVRYVDTGRLISFVIHPNMINYYLFVRHAFVEALDQRWMHSSIMSIGVFLPLTRGIHRFRRVTRCREAVHLARFLLCQEVMRLRLCSQGMRTSVGPSAVDYDWCKILLRKS